MPLPCMSFATPSLPNRIAPTGFRCSPFGTSGHPAASTMQGVSAKYPRIGFGGTESACTKTRVRLTPFSYGRGRFHAGSGRCFPSPIRRSFGRAMHQVTQERIVTSASASAAALRAAALILGGFDNSLSSARVSTSSSSQRLSSAITRSAASRAASNINPVTVRPRNAEAFSNKTAVEGGNRGLFRTVSASTDHGRPRPRACADFMQNDGTGRNPR